MSRFDPKSYPYLFGLIGNWFYQDFDTESDGSIEDVLQAYVRVSPKEVRVAVVRDIDRLLALPEDMLDIEFNGAFGNDIYITGWGMTARQWLERVRELLLQGDSLPHDT
jgi:hypothetical protein